MSYVIQVFTNLRDSNTMCEIAYLIKIESSLNGPVYFKFSFSSIFFCNACLKCPQPYIAKIRSWPLWRSFAKCIPGVCNTYLTGLYIKIFNQDISRIRPRDKLKGHLERTMLRK